MVLFLLKHAWEGRLFDLNLVKFATFRVKGDGDRTRLPTNGSTLSIRLLIVGISSFNRVDMLLELEQL